MTLAQTTITVTDQGPAWWQLSLLLLPVYVATVVILAALAVWLHRARAQKPGVTRIPRYAPEPRFPKEPGYVGGTTTTEDLSKFPDGWEGDRPHPSKEKQEAS